MCFVLLLFSFCFFVKLALSSRVDGANGLRNSKTTDIQGSLMFKNGLRSHSHASCYQYLIAPVQFEPHFQIGPDLHAELMLHWQMSRQTFSLVVLPVAHMDTQRTLEMTLTQRWNPSLNFPFILKTQISKVGPDYSFAIKQLASSYQAPGTRLHRKLRKRLHKLGALPLYSSSKQEPESSWVIFTVLSERSLASFELQRMLRSRAFSLHRVYVVHRLSNNLDESPRSMVQSLLQKKTGV